MATESTWSRIEVRVNPERTDPAGVDARASLALAGLDAKSVRVHRVFSIEGLSDAEGAARTLLIDPVLEQGNVDRAMPGTGTAVSVWKRPGVTDAVEASMLRALRSMGETPVRAVTGATYWIDSDATPDQVLAAVGQSIANEVIEEIGLGPVPPPRPLPEAASRREAVPSIPIAGLDDDALLAISRRYVLALDAVEMREVQKYFGELDRDPRLGELETVAQTWSEHCKHKTLAGPVHFEGIDGEKRYENLLKQTVFAATVKLDRDWCVSVFKDNAGIVRYDDKWDICFKVETHNHPSAIEPYGGAGTGIGGVIRDILGTGLAARPIANTDVFCFGNLDTTDVPKGVLPPLRVMKGVVAGVRDYGNRMGIPTVNGALCFDDRYLGNPIVYAGTVGIIPRGKAEKAACPGDLIVAVGGRTGRDGIHGATFSSEALHDESDTVSGGAVQIGNPIEEKKVLDTILLARDRELFTAVTDCGAGGFSSAVGEMGEEVGAEVWLERAPLKYAGLSPVEIWISEAQERMVLSVPPEHEAALLALFAAEDVEAVVIGCFTGDANLLVKHDDEIIVDLPMSFLHDGLPIQSRTASWTAPAPTSLPNAEADIAEVLLRALSDGNVCSKEWVVRQYDHEVQAGSAIKPLVGREGRGPGNAAAIVPNLGSKRGVAVGNGIGPQYGDLDPYRMAMLAVDEAIRNIIAIGAGTERIAILDNFSWGDCRNPETLGACVRACEGCHDAAMLFETPFISGKDSLNNEFRGENETIRIPHTLLISAMGQIDDVTKCVTSDAKRAGNKLVLVGLTWHETGGGFLGAGEGECPQVRDTAPATMRAVAESIAAGKIRSCHDLSEGGLAVAAAEMAIGGALGVRIDPAAVPCGETIARNDVRLFSETPSRFLLEVEGDVAFDVPHAVVGEVTDTKTIQLGETTISLDDARKSFFCWENLL